MQLRHMGKILSGCYKIMHEFQISNLPHSLVKSEVVL